ncbi:GNAT family N-acetyltransferase [Paenibacillus typhae]|uniref:Protein N-acetyltransferase, RimJ/RimL family n=1 Tax=Paenibacillus typhae TaxID=1174501 RepID=A0A1G8YHS5_9BACL|nr:GNAT family N-acetyltransferase [Paenibacillus typhae]SDK01660.1 Protein N-acetyltransferase, RimJ/RimL family [Paenibacillus typhae]
MELAGERVLIRDFCENDREFFAELEGHELTSKFENNHPDAVQIEDDFNNALLHPANVPREHFKLMVCRAEDRTQLGIISIKLNWKDIREWEIGWALHPEYWRHGYATEAVRLLIGYAFKELNAHRIVAYANAANERSERLMQRVGITKDGVLRETRYCNRE